MSTRKIVNTFLKGLSERISKDLQLDENGICAYHYDKQVFVIEVPKDNMIFSIYTILGSVNQSKFKEAAKKMLELNFLQQDTMGGVLALDPENGRDVILSYMDRPENLSQRQFLMALENFIEVSLNITEELSGLVITPKDKKIVRLVK